jgi:thymidylate kinase
LISDQNPIYKICFTGGPCAGKTTAIASLQNTLQERGYRVFCVPEAATMLMKGGAMGNSYDFNFS